MVEPKKKPHMPVEEPPRWYTPFIPYTILSSGLVMAKGLYDGSFSYVNYKLFQEPNSDLIAWKHVGDQTFAQLMRNNEEIQAMFGKIQPGNKLYVTKQQAGVHYMLVDIDKRNPYLGSRFRLFEYVGELQLKLPFSGEGKEGQFILDLATIDGRWTPRRAVVETPSGVVVLKQK